MANNLIDINTVQSRMLIPRNQHVLLDGYILELTPEECSRSQIVTLNGKLKHTVRRVKRADDKGAK